MFKKLLDAFKADKDPSEKLLTHCGVEPVLIDCHSPLRGNFNIRALATTWFEGRKQKNSELYKMYCVTHYNNSINGPHQAETPMHQINNLQTLFTKESVIDHLRDMEEKMKASKNIRMIPHSQATQHYSFHENDDENNGQAVIMAPA